MRASLYESNWAERPQLITKHLGVVDYITAWRTMRNISTERGTDAPDEIWMLQHPPVYTLGLSCKFDEYNDLQEIPLVASDRGGEITYHGPGQVVAYVLMDLKRRKWGVRRLVESLEQAVIDLLAGYGVLGERHHGAPGVYVAGKKLASIGLRIRQGKSYHGVSLNVDMDLGPFRRIPPCGYHELEMTQLVDLGVTDKVDAVSVKLLAQLKRRLAYS